MTGRPLSARDLELLAAMVDEGSYVLAGWRVGRTRQAVANRLGILRDRYECPTTLQLIWAFRADIEAHRAADDRQVAA